MNADQDEIIKMDSLIRVHPRSSAVRILPVPRTPIAVRVATMDDLPFLDALQKKHSRALGYFPTKQFEGYIEGGHVLIAEESSTSLPKPLGYVISKDRYLKRDELGVIYQLCVAPDHQRGLIGASLIKAVFERSAYGCRLYCCWCAQDLAANHFWESLGFVPIAFRAGSTGKRRVHIFWQKRIVENDATPWWYPFKTDQGAMREDRIVFPIPPGVHWKDVQPVVLPSRDATPQPMLGDGKHDDANTPATKPAVRKRASKDPQPPAIKRYTPSGLRSAPEPAPVPKKPAKKPKAPPKKIDPMFLSGARELRDRYLEKVNTDPHTLRAKAKYAISRSSGGDVTPVALLPAA